MVSESARFMTERLESNLETQKATLGLYREIEHVVFRAADGAEEDGVDLLRLGHRGVGQGRAVRVVGRAAHEVLAHVEGEAALRAVPVDDLADLCHDLWADAVAGRADYRFSDAERLGNVAILEALVRSSESGRPEAVSPYAEPMQPA